MQSRGITLEDKLDFDITRQLYLVWHVSFCYRSIYIDYDLYIEYRVRRRCDVKLIGKTVATFLEEISDERKIIVEHFLNFFIHI